MELVKARWTYACSRCDWIGITPECSFLYGYRDCPCCGGSCTQDEESFEPIKEDFE